MAFGMTWDPFREFERVERLLRRGLEGRFGEIASPAVEVTDEGDHYMVRAELPGVQEKDVEVTLSGNVLSIRGEKRYEKKEGSGDKPRRKQGEGSRQEQKEPGESGRQRTELAKSEGSETGLARPMYSEIFYGRFERVLTLPDDIDPENVDAEFEDGVLHLTIGKKEQQRSRKISITKH